jgi:hypothetical protein
MKKQPHRTLDDAIVELAVPQTPQSYSQRMPGPAAVITIVQLSWSGQPSLALGQSRPQILVGIVMPLPGSTVMHVGVMLPEVVGSQS